MVFGCKYDLVLLMCTKKKLIVSLELKFILYNKCIRTKKSILYNQHIKTINI